MHSQNSGFVGMIRVAVHLMLILALVTSSGCLSALGRGKQFRDARTSGVDSAVMDSRTAVADPSVIKFPGKTTANAAGKSASEASRAPVSEVAFNTEDNQDIAVSTANHVTSSLPVSSGSEKSNSRSGEASSPANNSDLAQNATITLTLDQAEQQAIACNPDLRKAQADIEALQGKYIQTGLRPNPQVGYFSADVGEEGTAGQQGGFVSQEFIRGDKLKLNRSIVAQEIAAAKQQLEINRQKLMTEVRQRFYDLLIAQERVNLVNKFSQLSQNAVSISDKRYQAEEISKIADLRARIQDKNISIVNEQAQNDLAAATRRLAAATGIGQPDTIEPGSIVATGVIYPDVSIFDPQYSFNNLLESSPELSQAAAELEQAKWTLHRQIAEPIRNVQVQTFLTHGNATGDDLVAVQVGVPLRINDRNQGNICSARSEVSARAENIESLKRDLSRRFSVVWREYENARIQIQKYQNEIIPAASEFYKLVESAFQEGELGYLDLVSAQQAYLDASLQNLAALQGFWRAAALIDGYLLSED